MSALSLRLPNSLHKQLRELARREGVSINQLVNSAVAEKMAALMTVDYLKERAERGSRQKFEGALAQVPDVEAQEGDQLPGAVSRRRRASRVIRSDSTIFRASTSAPWTRAPTTSCSAHGYSDRTARATPPLGRWST